MKFAQKFNKKFFGIFFFAALMSFGIVACGGEKAAEDDASEKMEETMDEAKDEADKMMDKAKEKADQMTDEAKAAMDTLSEKAKEKMDDMKGGEKKEDHSGSDHPN